jgi:ankyrin repeat protein
VRARQLEIAAALLKGGRARRTRATRYGVTPLALAAETGSLPMVDLLVRPGPTSTPRIPTARPC